MLKSANKYRLTFIVLCVVLFITILLSIALGAVTISVSEMISATGKWMNGDEPMTLNERIFLQIRLPRALMCLSAGAALACGGVLMQALFRNPIVEPGLVGTSSGAAFGAALYFVMGAVLKINLGEWTLPIAACAGGMLSTMLVFSLSQHRQGNRNSIISLLLTGIAINALFMSGVGFLSYIARDPQARSITFWNLGTLSGSNWHSLLIVSFFTLLCLIIALRYAKQLNALMIGEEEAFYLGVNVRRLKLIVLSINVVMIAVVTSFTGVIAFVGLIVPHLLRMISGSDNRFLLINGALLGGIILGSSDLAARLILAPAELPIGIVTSLIGVPVFILLLRRNNYFF